MMPLSSPGRTFLPPHQLRFSYEVDGHARRLRPEGRVRLLLRVSGIEQRYPAERQKVVCGREASARLLIPEFKTEVQHLRRRLRTLAASDAIAGTDRTPSWKPSPYKDESSHLPAASVVWLRVSARHVRATRLRLPAADSVSSVDCVSY